MQFDIQCHFGSGLEGDLILCFTMSACSRDGSVRLWDCGEAKYLAVVSKSDCPVNSCALKELHGMENDTPGADLQQSKRKSLSHGMSLKP